jgi:hypothetical protein
MFVRWPFCASPVTATLLATYATGSLCRLSFDRTSLDMFQVHRQPGRRYDPRQVTLSQVKPSARPSAFFGGKQRPRPTRTRLFGRAEDYDSRSRSCLLRGYHRQSTQLHDGHLPIHPSSLSSDSLPRGLAPDHPVGELVGRHLVAKQVGG